MPDQGASAPSPSHLRSRRWWLLAIVVVGVALRAFYFSSDTSLWGDEAAVARNLRDGSYADLVRPLRGGQHAPYLHLVAEKALFDAWGVNERALRFPAFAASIVALVLFPVFAGRIASSFAVLAGTALFALSPALVRYAAELKPYSGDVAAAIIAGLIATKVFEAGYSRRSVAILAVVGALLLWVSYGVAFVLCAVGVTLFVDRVRAKDRTAIAGLMVVAGTWAASFAGVYWTTARHSAGSAALADFWHYAFAPFPPASAWDVRRSIELFFSPFVNPMELSGAAIGAALAIFGLASLWRRDIRFAALCGLPILVTFAASAADAYPFATRLILFLMPFMTVLVAEGIATVQSALPGGATRAALTAIVLAGPVVQLNEVLEAPERSGVRDTLSAMAERSTSDAAVYVYYKAQASFDVYADQLGDRPPRLVNGSDDVREDDRVTRDLAQLDGLARVWFLFSEVHTYFVDEEQLMLREIEKQAKRIDQISVGPTRAYLYEAPSQRWTSE